MKIDLSAYDLIVAIDSNIVLEYQPLEQLAWREIGMCTSVLIIVVPQVSSEIDKFKRDARLSNRARAFGKRTREFVSSGLPTELRSANPKVSLALVRPGTVDWISLGLDPAEGDDRVVGQVRTFSDETGCAIKFLSGDAYPIHVAKGLGIDIHFANESWLLPPETSAQEKRIKEQETKIRSLESRLPAISVALETDPSVLCLSKVSPPNDVQIAELTERFTWTPLINLNIFRSFNTPGSSSGNITKEDVEKYNRALRLGANTLHIGVEAIRRQFKLSINVQNAGQVAGDSLRIEISTLGADLSDELFYSIGWPPRKPDPNDHLIRNLYMPNVRRPAIFDPEEVSCVIEKGNPSKAIIECPLFRQGRSVQIQLFGVLTATVGNTLCLSARSSCSNGHGVSDQEIDINVLSEVEAFEQAYDLAKADAKHPDSIAKFIEERFARGDYSKMKTYKRES
jgi:hypothetical protein